MKRFDQVLVAIIVAAFIAFLILICYVLANIGTGGG